MSAKFIWLEVPGLNPVLPAHASAVICKLVPESNVKETCNSFELSFANTVPSESGANVNTYLAHEVVIEYSFTWVRFPLYAYKAAHIVPVFASDFA